MTLQTALEWLEQGINPIPLQPGKKWMFDGDRYKNYDHLHSLPEVVKVFNGKRFNLAIFPAYSSVTGKHLVVLDFDDNSLWWQWYTMSRSETLTTTTKRGKHCYFWCEVEPDKQLRSDIAEIKYQQPVTVPPSKVKGFVYTDNGQDIKEVRNIESVVDCHLCATRTASVKKKTIEIANSSFHAGREGVARTSYTFNQVKQSISILTYLSTYHKLPSDTSGKFITCFCPVHDDTSNPSLSVNPSKGLVKCNVPSCKLSYRWYDIVGLHAIVTGLNNGQAANDLAEQFL